MENNKIKIIERLRRKITPEFLKKMKEERINEKKSKSLEYQLGFYVGQYIIDHYLLTLSVDIIKTRNVIEVSKEDTDKLKDLEEIWLKSSINKNDEESTNHFWNQYMKFYKVINEKYYPKILKCHLSTLNVENITEFKRGLIVSLWDCDCCAYSLKPEEIKIYDEDDMFFTIIELKRYDED